MRMQIFYEHNRQFPATNPRQLFKISHYTHDKFANVWVAYLSGINPPARAKLLSYAFLIIQVENELKIAAKYIYSNQRGMSTIYGWEELGGQRQPSLDSLGKLVGVERYLEPSDKIDSLKLYQEEK